MISDEYFWAIWAQAAITAGCDTDKAAIRADEMLKEYKMRFKRHWLNANMVGPFKVNEETK